MSMKLVDPSYDLDEKIDQSLHGNETFRDMLERGFGVSSAALTDHMLNSLRPTEALEGMHTWIDAYEGDPEATVMLAFQHLRTIHTAVQAMSPHQRQTLIRLFEGAMSTALGPYHFRSCMWGGLYGIYPEVREAGG